MSEYVTKAELDKALRKQTDEIVGIMQQLVDQIDGRFNRLEGKVDHGFAELNEKYGHLISTIDGFLRRLDEVETEQAARDSQFQRLLIWARKVSEKTGIPLGDL